MINESGNTNRPIGETSDVSPIVEVLKVPDRLPKKHPELETPTQPDKDEVTISEEGLEEQKTSDIPTMPDKIVPPDTNPGKNLDIEI
jgi:hypothetical protein